MIAVDCPYDYGDPVRVRIVTDGPEGEHQTARWLVGVIHSCSRAESKDPLRQWRLDVRVPPLDIIDGTCPRCNGNGLLSDDEEAPSCDQCGGTGNMYHPYTCRVYCADDGYGTTVVPNWKERE